MKRFALGAAILVCGLGLQLAEADAAKAQAKAPAPVWPPAKPEAIEAWKDLRFGMFIHWGPVSLTGRELGWSRGRETPIEVYDNLYRKFNPVKFNADEWVNIAKAGGMKYIVLVTKHHDGFCLWDTKYTDHNIMHTPFKRDVVKELAEACRKQGIKFGTYYSVCDWHHPDFPLTGYAGKVRREESNLDAYQQYLLNQIRELIVNYGPLLTIWNDVPQEFKGRGAATIKMVRELQPDILINDRSGDGGDYSTPEQCIGGFQKNRPWESCMTVSANNHWAWGGAKDGVKDLATCLKFLIRAAGGDGNMLLNVGPSPDGEIVAEQRERLKEMGDWLTKYGECIYGTRGGPYKPTKNLACTHKGNAVYLHVLRWEGEKLELPALGRKIVKSELLTGGKVEVKQDERGVAITVAKADQQSIVTVIKLELDGPAAEIVPIRVNKEESTACRLLGGSLVVITASSTLDQNHGVSRAADRDVETRWIAAKEDRGGWLEIESDKDMAIGRAVVIAKQARMQRFALEAFTDNAWCTLVTGDHDAGRVVFDFPPVKARRFRLNLLSSVDSPTIEEFQLLAPGQELPGNFKNLSH